jgi:hypothetical protein
VAGWVFKYYSDVDGKLIDEIPYVPTLERHPHFGDVVELVHREWKVQDYTLFPATDTGDFIVAPV